jgi:hypothetical protein
MALSAAAGAALFTREPELVPPVRAQMPLRLPPQYPHLPFCLPCHIDAVLASASLPVPPAAHWHVAGAQKHGASQALPQPGADLPATGRRDPAATLRTYTCAWHCLLFPCMQMLASGAVAKVPAYAPYPSPQLPAHVRGGVSPTPCASGQMSDSGTMALTPRSLSLHMRLMI